MPTKATRKLACLLAMVGVLVISMLAISPQPASAENLPRGTASPFIWDNDSESDAFSLDLIMALAHLGVIKLVGISESPHPYRTASENYQAIVEKARNSGWKNIPDASWDLGSYYMTALSRPSNGSIDGTSPLDTAPARMIRDKVLSVGTTTTPVVVGTGGALTTVASAYLLANQAGRGAEFASKMVLYGGIGAGGGHVLNGYNDAQDEWAVYVCQQRLKVVFTEYSTTSQNQPNFWAMIDTLPNNEIGQYMKTTKANWPYAPYQGVGDEMAVLSLINPTQGSYFNNTERVNFDHWQTTGWAFGQSGPNNLNWNAYQAYLNLRTDPTSDDVATWGLNSVDAYITNTFNQAFSGTPTGTNLALNKPATASSVQQAGWEAGKAVDGDSSTRWSAQMFADPQWIRVDLGAVRSIDRVRLNWETAYASSYRIQVSSDAATWTDVFSTTTGNGGVDDVTFSAADARYVRMYGTVRGSQWGYSLYEFEVYGS